MKKSSSRRVRALALGLGGLAVGTLVVAWVRRATRIAPITVESRITVAAPLHEVWQAWAPLVTLPVFMEHVERVEDLGNGRSRWTARLADGSPPLVWEAEETERVEQSVIRWQTIDGQPFHSSGEVRFENDTLGRGTIVRLRLGFEPGQSPAQLAATFLKGLPKHLARRELRRFQAFVETGEVPTIDGQPSGREPLKADRARTLPDTDRPMDLPYVEPVIQA
jgi:uncharacterized membrane protein